ncbi:hypothetical protein C8A05DRAFT_17150, partial [Staphylotrichum tortipilum]
QQPAPPLLVDTAWPAIAHAARGAALASGAVRLRYSPTAGCAVPYRHFIPAIDTLYLAVRLQLLHMLRFLTEGGSSHIGRHLRHLAISMNTMSFSDRIPLFIWRKARRLRTLSIVFPGAMDLESSNQRFALPERRCMLREMPDSALDQHMVAQELGETAPRSFWQLLGKVRETVGSRACLMFTGTKWTEFPPRSSRKDVRSGLEVKAQTFVEYSRAEDGRGQWVEVCRDRLLPSEGLHPRPLNVVPEDYKNPEKYRVLDDDIGWWHLKEPVPWG